MVLFTKAFTWTLVLLAKIINAFSTVPGSALIATPTIHLYSNVYTPTPTDTASVFVECVFSGYAAASATLTGPVNGPTQTQCAVANALFVATTATPFVPDTAQGYFVMSGTTLVGAEKFASPVPFAGVGAFLDLTVMLPLGEFVVA